ncbi:MAG TPA: hypothetical protein VKD70_08590 [Candidatus Acidoferrum sp.]|nr:hypothetical protein [Candidatus Acidoferrum sp.]
MNHVPARILAAGLLLGSLLCAAGPSRAGNEKATSAAAFERLISLVGEWEGTNSSGHVKATYTLVSGGTALMERLQPTNEAEMVTLYSLDGDHLLITHYCSGGNQPSMRTGAISELNGTFSFKVFQVTGMKAPDEDHMTALILTMPDKDHFTQQWTYKGKGKEQSDLFKFTRKS